MPSGTAVPSTRPFRDKGTGAEPADISQNSPAWTELGVTRCAGESGEEGVLPRQPEPSGGVPIAQVPSLRRFFSAVMGLCEALRVFDLTHHLSRKL